MAKINCFTLDYIIEEMEFFHKNNELAFLDEKIDFLFNFNEGQIEEGLVENLMWLRNGNY